MMGTCSWDCAVELVSFVCGSSTMFSYDGLIGSHVVCSVARVS